jgi:hypothetical protein
MIVKRAIVRSGIKMRGSNDPTLQQLSGNLNSKRRETERWELFSQSHGVRDFRGDKIGNAWLRNPKLLKPSRHMDALKLRTNTFSTRIVQ